ncbi:MAG: hypothetical protein DRJ03_00660 [Chloroflexi bacterium]|nr:MAG: hypothetical protein DRJ03_00660 [Chloroflexota bacterium]
MGKRWTIDETDVLRNHYDCDGIAFCMQRLDRSRMSVTRKAYTLGLTTSNPRPKLRRRIVAHLGKNKVIAECPSRGDVLHYYGYSGQSLQCAECTRVSTQKWRQSTGGKVVRRRYDTMRRQSMVVNYANRLRSRLNYYKKIGASVTPSGCFRYLPFSPIELHDHLEHIRFVQQNRCPVCSSDYDEVGYQIDHVQPLAIAKSDEEVWSLFNLSNLSLLCPRCNGDKGDSVGERSFYPVSCSVLSIDGCV